ncbi:hypothetical protein RSOL_400530 [Rhizoctonia solani AG-3 Rhs1AP]|uniref:Uncharacterized protein n=1 Tax=Rhizoctonia solani AG-3 Rhs1AP TaxID=1086054 RepID=X8JF60_9AGAM|nr:hypothetical protein RSOL_400530 [Rhizoctonia solani AG-3 Rhs1AP]
MADYCHRTHTTPGEPFQGLE